MAKLHARLQVLVIICICCLVQRTESRKLLNSEKKEVGSALEESLALRALPLPEGCVPPSTPSNKGHSANPFNEKHFAAAPAHIERNLQSVPSPGIGH